MLCRNSTLKHPQGPILKTPLLIPSFSSKGFRKYNDKCEEEDEIKKFISFTQEDLMETILLSAYDLHHKLIPDIDGLPLAEIIFVDSGGYETSRNHDLSAVYRQQDIIFDWTYQDLLKVHKDWAKYPPSVYVTFDKEDERHVLEDQIKFANNLMKFNYKQMYDFLIKPESLEDEFVNVDKVIENCDALKCFDIIGVTEKELGDSFISRMLNISKLRIAFDKNDIRAPIHIFGSLDPLSCYLYFLAGAEIFDGLTWLRFAFDKGNAVYYHNYGAMEFGATESAKKFWPKIVVNNIKYLKEMKLVMDKFVREKDFSLFKFNIGFIQDSYDKLQKELEGGN